MSELPYRTYPCAECPVRRDTAGKPDSCFPAERWEALSVTVRDPDTGEHPRVGQILFGCHMGAPSSNADLACAGWLARFGGDHLTVRIALVQGRLPASVLQPGTNWPELCDTWADVVQNHTTGVSEPSGNSTARRMDSMILKRRQR